jgi:hypothetical protein
MEIRASALQLAPVAGFSISGAQAGYEQVLKDRHLDIGGIYHLGERYRLGTYR